MGPGSGAGPWVPRRYLDSYSDSGMASGVETPREDPREWALFQPPLIDHRVNIGNGAAHTVAASGHYAPIAAPSVAAWRTDAAYEAPGAVSGAVIRPPVGAATAQARGQDSSATARVMQSLRMPPHESTASASSGHGGSPGAAATPHGRDQMNADGEQGAGEGGYPSIIPPSQTLPHPRRSRSHRVSPMPEGLGEAEGHRPSGSLPQGGKDHTQDSAAKSEPGTFISLVALHAPVHPGESMRGGPFHVRAVDLTYKIKLKGSQEERTLLNGVNAEARPGEILAIAGPSGAGKSTFLDAISGRIRFSSLQGEVLLNGKPVDSTFRQISGYVMQDDQLFPMLTVRETLLFSARLRIPNSCSREEKASRVEAVISELGLAKCADSIIGDEKVRGVSGGERRRVSIGVDLIHDPAVLFLDEPTSGLDSVSALSVIRILKELAVQRRRTIVLTIHQPSFRILELIDNFLILARGQVVYHGSYAGMAPHFHTFSRAPLIERANGLEYAMDVIEQAEHSPPELEALLGRGVPSSDSQEGDLWTPRHGAGEEDSSWHTQGVPLSYQGGPGANGGASDAEEPLPLALGYSVKKMQRRDYVDSPAPKSSGSMPRTGSQDSSTRDGPESSDEAGVLRPQFATGFLSELLVLTERSFKNILRTRELFYARMLTFIVAGVLIGALYFRAPTSPLGVQDRLHFFAFGIMAWVFTAIEALPVFLAEREIFIRESSRGAYRTASYVLAGTLAFLPFLVVTAVTCLIPYFMLGLAPTFAAAATHVLAAFLTLAVGNSFVLFIAGFVPNYAIGVTIATAINAFFFLCSGFFISSARIPWYMIWLNYLSTFKYPLQMMMINQFQALDAVCWDPPPPDGLTATTCVLTSAEVLKSFDMAGINIWTNALVMLAFFVGYRFLFYLLLKWHAASVRA